VSYPTDYGQPAQVRQRVQQKTEEVYAFIETHVAEYGDPPTLRKIGAACHISKTASSRYLDRLEQQGRIMREPGVARGIRLVDKK
jgi:SOS-response transcriptional repressor LexA